MNVHQDTADTNAGLTRARKIIFHPAVCVAAVSRNIIVVVAGFVVHQSSIAANRTTDRGRTTAFPALFYPACRAAPVACRSVAVVARLSLVQNAVATVFWNLAVGHVQRATRATGEISSGKPEPF